MVGNHGHDRTDQGHHASQDVSDEYILGIGDDYDHVANNVDQMLCDAEGIDDQ